LKSKEKEAKDVTLERSASLHPTLHCIHGPRATWRHSEPSWAECTL